MGKGTCWEMYEMINVTNILVNQTCYQHSMKLFNEFKRRSMNHVGIFVNQQNNGGNVIY